MLSLPSIKLIFLICKVLAHCLTSLQILIRFPVIVVVVLRLCVRLDLIVLSAVGVDSCRHFVILTESVFCFLKGILLLVDLINTNSFLLIIRHLRR